MSADLKVSAEVLRKASDAAVEIAMDMPAKLTAAVRDTAAAAVEASGWSAGTALDEVAEEWYSALSALQERIVGQAGALHLASTNSAATEAQIIEEFQRIQQHG